MAEDDLGIELSEEEKKKAEDAAKENQPLFDALKNALEGKVKEVRLSQRLKNHAVCFASGDGLSIEMEKVLNQVPNQDKIKADKILEINGEHPVFKALQAAYAAAADDEKIGKYARLLYDQALLIEGLPVDDPVEFSNLICELMK